MTSPLTFTLSSVLAQGESILTIATEASFSVDTNSPTSAIVHHALVDVYLNIRFKISRIMDRYYTLCAALQTLACTTILQQLVSRTTRTCHMSIDDVTDVIT